MRLHNYRSSTIDDQTIADFGEQWTAFKSNTGYYGSVDLLEDICGGLVSRDDLVGSRCVDIGSGTGRIVRMLVGVGAASVIAVEPSQAVDVMEENTRDIADQVEIQRIRGDELTVSENLDLAFSIGVLHHIVDPGPTVKAMFTSLKTGGKILVWLYGREGNELYLGITTPIRKVTTKLPHSFLVALTWIISPFLALYGFLAPRLNLPMGEYFKGHLNKLTWKQRAWTIYDQLNPAHAHYYSKQEAEDLLARAGFQDIQLYHRHGYSWTVVGTKP